MINFGEVPAGAVLPIPFASYAAATGASVTLTGLAAADIEVYKGTSMTQRSSDAGYALMDTDGIDIDGITGIHGFSIDTGDNTDAGFYAAGSYFTVVVSAVTIDGQTVNFIAATFRLRAAETAAGVPKVDVSHISGDSAAADNLETAFDDTAGAVPWLGIVDQGVAQSASSTGLVMRSGAAFADGALVGSVLGAFGSTQGYWQFREITANVGSTDALTVDAWSVTPSGTVDYKVFGSAPASSGNPVPVNVVQISGDATAADNLESYCDGTTPMPVNTTQIEGSDATNQIRDAVVDDATRIDASALNTLSSHDPGEAIMGATDLGTGAGLTSLASAANLATVAGYLDTEIAAILADTNELQTDWANGGRLDLLLDARASQASVDDLPTSSELATALAAADDAVLAAIAALNNLSAAQVNAEVVDALATDTYAEPGQGAPGATISLAAKLGYLYKAFRNRSTQTTTQYTLYADNATTVDQKATVSDDTTTFDRGEIVTGP